MQINRLEELQREVDALKARKAHLEQIRDAKIAKLKLQIGILPSRFAAKHPILATLASEGGKAARDAAKISSNVITQGYRYATRPMPKPKRMHKIKKKHRSTVALKEELARLELENRLLRARKERTAYA